jgi:diacylglycerol kinase family enzyme
MRVLLLHNTSAGEGEWSREALLSLLRRNGHDVIYCSPGNRKWREVIDGDVELLVAAGGDGTAGELGRQVAGRDTPITILPLGTANNIATALGLSGRPLEELVAGWNGAERRAFDVGHARGSWGTRQFLESVGVGVLANAMHEIDHGSSSAVNDIKDSDARVAAARDVHVRIAERLTPIDVELTLDGRDLSGAYLLVESLNFGAAGPALRLSSRADGADGLLDVVLISEAERDTLVRHLRRGGELPSELPVHHGRHLTMRCHGTPVHADDQLFAEPETMRVEIEVTLQPGALTVLVPRGAATEPRSAA